MKPERYQVSAVTIDGGERVMGYLVFNSHTDSTVRPWVILSTVTGAARFLWDDGGYKEVEVDPVTIESVRVPVSIGENGNIYCPCCKSKIGILRGLKYCSHCGQALDWSKEPHP